MTDPAQSSPIPADDPSRSLAVARPGVDDHLDHIALAGDTYTILLGGNDTADKYTLIDMRVPAGGGPPPHRHDFEESFTLLEGEIEATFRDQTIVVRAGETVNVPANAPHSFRNASDQPVRMLCICAPAGQDAFFIEVGDSVPTPTTPAPKLSPSEMEERGKKAAALAPKYRTEFVR